MESKDGDCHVLMDLGQDLQRFDHEGFALICLPVDACRLGARADIDTVLHHVGDNVVFFSGIAEGLRSA